MPALPWDAQVRKESQEAFLLRNTGSADGRFSLSVPPPFAVTPCDGSLAAGQAMQIVFSFFLMYYSVLATNL